jgi:hypothetical protein
MRRRHGFSSIDRELVHFRGGVEAGFDDSWEGMDTLTDTLPWESHAGRPTASLPLAYLYLH